MNEPSNTELADLLDHLAELLALDGESVYKTIAYERAATAFREHPTSVARLALAGGLRALPGVGAAIEAKVLEYLSRGSIASLERLRAKYPDTLLPLIRIPGIGPKTARRLFETAGITSVDALRAAAVEGRLRAVPGMGKKTEENILRALDHLQAPSERRLLGAVDPVAALFVSRLRQLDPVRQADAAGSLRRRRSLVRDLDLVVGTDRPEQVMRAFGRFPEIASAEQQGRTKLTARTYTGLPVDLRAVSPGSYGNLLQHLTGSAEHNVALRGYAQRLGYKVCEYDVEQLATGQKHSYATEEEVYGRLGLPYIPPELREGGEELDAAREGRLPRLLELGDLRGDLHVHSRWSDGRAPLEEMALAARELGLEYLCFCDHSRSLGMAMGLEPEALLREVEAIRMLDEQLQGITLLAGTEVDILADGRLDFPDEILSRLDWVTASIHSGMKQPVEQIMARFEIALENPHVDAISHPTGRLLDRREPYTIDLDRLARRAAETGTALEINASYDRLDLSSEHARRARSLGARFVVCSDAHSPRALRLLHYGVGEARRAWLERDAVLNTLPLKELLRGRRGQPGRSKVSEGRRRI